MTPPATVQFKLHGHRIALYLPDPEDQIQSRILTGGGFDDTALLEDARARIRRGDLCVDVGAHVGNYTVFLAKVCGARVLAFEPRPEHLLALRHNVELNGLDDLVTTFDVALGESEGRGTLIPALPDAHGSCGLELGEDGPVAIWPLDEHVGEGRVALMRVDAAGLELEVLKGAERTLARDRPALHVVDGGGRQSRATIEAYLSQHGYVAVDQPAGARAVVFLPCAADERRLAALVHGLNRAHAAAAPPSADLNATMMKALDERLGQLEGQVGNLVGLLEHLARDNRDHSALLYELWNLGAQNHERLAGGDGRRDHASQLSYRPLNARAVELAASVRPRKSWTVARGSEAADFLQGYCSRLSARSGDDVGFRLSTDQVALFARVRVFGCGAQGWNEVHCSSPLYVPRTGVWQRGRGDVGEQDWQVSHQIRIDDRWTPGCYIVRFETFDRKATLHHFWVTTSKPTARTVLMTSALSHVARNKWGGGGLHRAGGRLRFGRWSRPPAVPLHRPYKGSRGSALLRPELSFQQWIRSNRMAVDIVSDLELHREPELLAGYEQVVIIGEATHLTVEVLAALGRYRDAGGNVAVLGAAPAEFEVALDLDSETLALRRQTEVEQREWEAANADLWATGQRWSQKAPLDLRFLPAAAPSAAGGGGRLDRATVAPGLCVGRVSGSTLEGDDPGLLARTIADGGDQERRCDTILVDKPRGGRVFVAGTDRWCTALEDSDRESPVSPEIASLTARVLGLTAEAAQTGPLVSVVMTAHESAQHIGRAIDSILSQSYSNLELIVVDDDSADETFEILLAYAEGDRRVRPFRSFRAQGAYWCRNYGMTVARGEFITFHESDGHSDEDRIAVQLDALRADSRAVALLADPDKPTRPGRVPRGRAYVRHRPRPSLMIRTAAVLPRLGFFDSVRGPADREYLRRLRLAFDQDQIVEITSPPNKPLEVDGSPSAAIKLPEKRSHYVGAYEEWHRRIERGESAPHLAFPLLDRPFEIPAEMAIDTPASASSPKRGALLTEVPTTRAAGRAILELGEDLNEVWHFVNCEGLGEVDDGGLPVKTVKAFVPRRRDARELGFTFTVDALPGQEAVASPSARAARSIVGIERTEERFQRLAAQEVARQSGHRPAEGEREFDVILLSDFRFPGGTSQSNAEEIKAQAQLGLSTGLLQATSPVIRQDRPINPVIERCVEAGLATFVPSGCVNRARLLVVRHPTLLMRHRSEIPPVQAEQVAVIINQPPVDAQSGRSLYSLAECQARAQECFGVPGTWFPIGPLVRKAIQGERTPTEISAQDWTNIINLEEWRNPRLRFAADRPVIGRHSRDSADKWPDRAEELLRAYPADGDIRVRILGGAESARKLLGYLPSGWNVFRFGSISAREFLAGIDFFVYYHHSRWIEAFGRSILEAMASGAPAILPPHFAELFGDAAIYSDPGGVRAIVQGLYGDRERYEGWSRKGIALVEDRFSYAAHARRLELMGCKLPASDPPEIRSAALRPR